MNGLVAANRRNNRAVSKYLAALLVASAPMIGGVAQAQLLPQPPQPPAQPLCTIPSATTPQTFASWFANGQVTANGPVTPADSVNFPSQNDCDFHVWAERMFLWLTSSSTSYGGTTPVFNSPIFYTVSAANTNNQRTYTQNKAGQSLSMVNVRAAQQGPHRLQMVTDKSGHEFEVLPATQAADGQSMINNAAGKPVEVNRVEVQNGKAVLFDQNDKQIALPKTLKMDTTLASRVAPMVAKLGSSNMKNMVQGLHVGNQNIFIDGSGNVIEPTQGQAGGGAVLLTQQNTLVYYSTVVNDVFAYFQTGMANKAFPAKMVAANLFPTKASERDIIVAYAKLHGVPLPDANALAMEIKMSWVDASILGAQASNYVTVPAVVPVYDTTTNPQLWTPQGTKSITLALVGMHVVGSAHNHPEMIWATFEHLNNTPSAQYTYTGLVNNVPTTVTVPQSTAGSWLFTANGAPAPYNVQKAVFASPNISGTQVDPTCVSTSTQPCALWNVGSSNTLRWKAWGTGSDASNVTQENTEVISTNNAVLSQLAAGDIRSNYLLIGSTWTNGGNTVETTNQLGTTFLSNTTMETYDQGTNTTGQPQTPNVAGNNCFGCHNNTYPVVQPANQPANTEVSHIYSDMIPLFPATPKK